MALFLCALRSLLGVFFALTGAAKLLQVSAPVSQQMEHFLLCHSFHNLETRCFWNVLDWVLAIGILQHAFPIISVAIQSSSVSRGRLHFGGSARVAEHIHPSCCLFGASGAAGYLPLLSLN
ncbi:transmembrane protein 35B isoform X2 [Meriones unguiculatus]|uniref:transmembrane protein 35B isoform X2 n=1 Tax=Meriones unguiculatus TaxID=10047 RepID=UPI00293F697B|nr:transmembrane protein 35B isoform X2 [Meriones unguiculatus]